MARLNRGRGSCSAAGLGLCLLALTAVASLPIHRFPPPHSTVVLMTGLPGDLESETSFREQIKSWLDLIENGGQAQRLVVLTDAPETVVLPVKTPTQTLKADRAHFLDLGRELAGQTNPLVVIAWGHGGRQGRNPVFHVRGPRLTPADFQALADQAAGRPSYWVLLFRESGAFARSLAGERRWTLSSECETAFASDPIGMGVMLRLVRAGAGQGFEALCVEVGRATESWYSERHLARTEEPTWWAERTSPRLLAVGTEEGSALPAKPATKAEAPFAAAPERESSNTNLPAAWQPILRVEARQFPDADGVILRRRISHTFGANPAVTVEHDEFIQVLTFEGKRLADFDFSYSPPFEDITFLDCELQQTNGALTRLDPEAIREVGAESVGDYQTGHRKFFSLPGVTPGAVLHLHYRSQWKEFPLPHVSMEVPITLDLPAIETVVTVAVPKASAFHFAVEGIASTDPVVSQSTYGSAYSWRFDNLPARDQDLLSSPHQQPRLLLSTFPDWRAFAEWYERLSRLTDTLTPELEAKAAELTRGAKTEREKVLALYNYVTALRYVAVPLGVNSLRPHSAAKVLQNQFGDCKDKANLFNTLLHTLKLEARLVLVPRFSQAHEAIPGLAFNHAISRLTLDGQPLWVDTTDDVCRFGLLPPGDPGRRVLVIDGQTEALTQLPLPDPHQHGLTIHGQVDCTRRTEALPVRLTATGTGFLDYDLRTAAREAKAHGATSPLLTARFRPVAGAFALRQQSGTAVSALDEDFSWQAEGTCVGLAATTPGHWVVHAPFWLPKEWDLALYHRTTPLFLNQGYPLSLDQEFVFTSVPPVGPVSLPIPVENDQPPLRWRVGWAKIGDDKLAAHFHAELVSGELSPKEFPLAQRQIQSLFAALAADAIFPSE